MSYSTPKSLSKKKQKKNKKKFKIDIYTEK